MSDSHSSGWTAQCPSRTSWLVFATSISSPPPRLYGGRGESHQSEGGRRGEQVTSWRGRACACTYVVATSLGGPRGATSYCRRRAEPGDVARRSKSGSRSRRLPCVGRGELSSAELSDAEAGELVVQKDTVVGNDRGRCGHLGGDYDPSGIACLSGRQPQGQVSSVSSPSGTANRRLRTIERMLERMLLLGGPPGLHDRIMDYFITTHRFDLLLSCRGAGVLA